MGAAPPNSQVSPLPTNLPFRLISKTIGSGAYAAIRKATPLNRSSPVIAVKFINKEHAFRIGHLRPKQLQIELSLHQYVSGHANIIQFLSHGADDAWVWLCLELAAGGDLFDKIEADEGVEEDVAHFYFVQLVDAIKWCHSKGVAHRDIKPENMLLAASGDLKLADFGLATKFRDPRTGARKRCAMICGSPPYVAPEILTVGKLNAKQKREADASAVEKADYDPEITDVWSCAIVLFVLLAGNTPWDSPVIEESEEYADYIASDGQPSGDEELWDKIPSAAMSLLRGMLRVSVDERSTLSHVRKHPWFTRFNPHLGDKGQAANPVSLATQMLESLHIDFSQDPSRSQRRSKVAENDEDAMEIDGQESQQQHEAAWTRFASTQPETPLAVEGTIFDWEAPPRLGSVAAGMIAMSASQPSENDRRHHQIPAREELLAALAEDPGMSQFSQTPAVPLTLTQQARQFADIVPAHTLARFCSTWARPQLMELLLTALHSLSIPVTPPSEAALRSEQPITLRIRTLDTRKQALGGVIVTEAISLAAGQPDVLAVSFIKAKGDPLGWRRLFKSVAVLCKDAVLKM